MNLGPPDAGYTAAERALNQHRLWIEGGVVTTLSPPLAAGVAVTAAAPYIAADQAAAMLDATRPARLARYAVALLGLPGIVYAAAGLWAVFDGGPWWLAVAAAVVLVVTAVAGGTLLADVVRWRARLVRLPAPDGQAGQ